MSDDRADEAPVDRNAVEALKNQTVVSLRAVQGHPDSVRQVIVRYLREGYRLGLVPSELIDYFCVDTPNIVEAAGYTDASGDAVVDLFDELHDEFRRTGGNIT